ncbi:hypothetical protein SEA_SEPHIROTH_114 [Gordonia Phage Sephiroth]|uniref:Uncharacterized protein n=1 Tax=Gordonia Phage Sephiroth TaxID=2767553 RepID=A0A7G9UZJ3_9CAUD|nr:hypothetical protein L3Y23_gp117 [Gordonia Phage Sephiroth]QNN99448.1 hypothetical protein SEA_SEPHIROTH_114 [Gordonia Phage Sephiroth]
MRYRKKPVEVDAQQWNGRNYLTVDNFTEGQFLKANNDDPDKGPTGHVYDRLHASWVGVMTGDFIIRGIQGEYYPCNADVFEETYEVVP